MSHNFDYKKQYVPLAQHLRKNMTEEERTLWYKCLVLLPIRAHRQKNIGNYIVDFYIPKKKIVIEVDGSQHDEPENRANDMVRDCRLRERGVEVLRYKNSDVNEQLGWVVRDILKHLELDEKETLEYMRKEYRRRKGYKDK